MCGIAGILRTASDAAPPEAWLLERMAGCLDHRGPDEAGLYCTADVGLVHRRLSIIDVASGQQPMSSEDGRLWITFNGEIFNYVELRNDLQAQGHRFRTHSDTEVILAAFRHWGDDAFRRFNGQWALAIWDEHARSLTLSRDRVGVRPLFVCERPGRLMFASEVRALFTDPSVPRRFDPAGLGEVFHRWAATAPRTVFDGIRQIPPATTWTVDRSGRSRESTFWSPRFQAPISAVDYGAGTRKAHTEELRARLTDATRLRMIRSDVPVGSYLSGGLDSSVIAALGRAAHGGAYHTFSIRFTDAAFDEAPYQQLMSRHVGSIHHELEVSRSEIARVFPDVVRHAESPLLRTAPAPMYLLSESVRRGGIKAVLTGEGADEFLAGYDLFREAKIREFWSRAPGSTSRPKLFERIYPYLSSLTGARATLARDFWKQGLAQAADATFSHEPRWRSTLAVRKFFLDEYPLGPPDRPMLPEEFQRWDPLHRAQYLEITILLSGYLLSSQGDRMLMAHSVEGRFPFLDQDVMEFCLTLPPSDTLPFLDEKRLLKDVAQGLVPAEIVRRKKQPYRAPDAAVFVGPNAPEYVDDLLSEPSLRDAGVFDPVRVAALRSKLDRIAGLNPDPTAISNTDNMSLIGILSTQMLHRSHLRAAATAKPPRWTVYVDRTDPHATPLRSTS